jgi:hypothetical protein
MAGVAGLLQELHRHLPEAHKDRGDAQRAAKIMADLSVSWATHKFMIMHKCIRYFMLTKIFLDLKCCSVTQSSPGISIENVVYFEKWNEYDCGLRRCN